jgi:hypothetical protein
MWSCWWRIRHWQRVPGERYPPRGMWHRRSAKVVRHGRQSKPKPPASMSNAAMTLTRARETPLLLKRRCWNFDRWLAGEDYRYRIFKANWAGCPSPLNGLPDLRKKAEKSQTLSRAPGHSDGL